MPVEKGKVRHAIVAVDYFTKWAEVEPMATITKAKIEDFVWKNILCRFSIPNAIVTDNGRQFNNNKFRMFCSKFNINLCFTSPAHPQSNGQVEVINKIIKRTLKTSLDKAKVVGISRPGSYKLRSSDGKTIGHPWKADHLKYYYK
ncbi:hypothetical protein ACFX13_013684 [Malus domestica]